MNSTERLARRLRGEPVDRPPNLDILMNLAAHHIGATMKPYYLDHRVLVAANLAVQPEFSLDVVQAISDPYREAHDLGSEIEFPDDGMPMLARPAILDYPDLKNLRFVAPEDGRRMSDRLEAVRLFRDRVGGEVPIMGWVEGALAEAADVRGINELMVDLVIEPAWVEELLERCCQVEIAFARAQVAAGADIIGLGDAVASLVNPEHYEKYALPYEKRIFDAVHAMGALARLHICGRTAHITHAMVRSGADIIDVDWMVDLERAATTIADRAAVCGNFDPVTVMLQGTPEDAHRATLACARMGGPRWISAGGCEIPDGTPSANLYAQAAALRELGAAVPQTETGQREQSQR